MVLQSPIRNKGMMFFQCLDSPFFLYINLSLKSTSLSDPLYLPHLRSSSTTSFRSGDIGIGASTIPAFEHGVWNWDHRQ